MRSDRGVDVLQLMLWLGLVWDALANPVRPPTEARDVRTAPHARVVPLALLPEVRGASDLAADPSGRLWVVTERSHLLVPVEGGAPLPIRGVAKGMDLEALTFTGDSEVLLGTERDEERTTDTLLEGRIEDGQVSIVGARTIDYAALGVEVLPNHGIEGVCAAGGQVVLALEDPVVRDGRRLGVLVVGDRVVTMPLSSRTGKLAGLSCAQEGPDRVVIWAIERHFGVARVLRAVLTPGTAALEAETWVDLAPAFPGRLPNLEGIVVRADDVILAEDDDPSAPGTVTTVFRATRTATVGGS